ncbi:CBS domain-containing protein [Desulfurivibrio alkaliphilus]|uniref:CBS domain containing protein n=1 Tax=Desulfurivibrio alkaliphilus (strain DSM 19089 / UNIQEM U267 / AHT2) TaxID=589865 RepID=D6Z0E5_DESAT|nr:CBS domain-containing protein [Desulfurivibrio alkaliphilus]ADH87178.1 CBS domain containing protein [Desulfurivibrio alkaliphilus AHT 2]
MTAESEGKEHFLVKGLLIPMKRFPHIDEDLNLHEAVRALQEYTCGEYERMRYSEMLVVDAKQQLVGRVNLQSILKGLDPNLGQVIDGFEGKRGEFPNLAILWGDSFFETCNRRFGNNVKDFMVPLPPPVKEQESAFKALSIMLTHNETVLPVLAEDGSYVVGVIRLEEIFNAIVKRCDT